MLTTRAIRSKDRGEVRGHAFRRRPGTLAVVAAIDRDGHEAPGGDFTEPRDHPFFRATGSVQRDDHRLPRHVGPLEHESGHALPSLRSEGDLFDDEAGRLWPRADGCLERY